MGYGSFDNRSNDNSLNVDGSDWYIQSCPASGPDAIMYGDSVYSVFMNGGTGSKKVYVSSASLSTGDLSGPWTLTQDFTGVGLQDYPRIGSQEHAVAAVWRQIRNSKIELAIAFTKDIRFNTLAYVASLEIGNSAFSDITVYGDSVFVVWQDNASKTVKYRAGHIGEIASLKEFREITYSLYPNPAQTQIYVEGPLPLEKLTLVNAFGQVVVEEFPETPYYEMDISGLKSGTYYLILKPADKLARRQVLIVN